MIVATLPSALVVVKISIDVTLGLESSEGVLLGGVVIVGAVDSLE